MGSKGSGSSLFDKRLIGTWRSDKRRTAAEIQARRDLPVGRRRTMLMSLFGRLTIRYTRSRYYVTLNGFTEALPLRVVAQNADGVVVVSGDEISHVRFERRPNGQTPRYYWISLGQFREYFRKVNRVRSKFKSKRR